MKRFVILLIAVTCLTSFKTIIPPLDSYAQQTDMFAGSWKYQNGQEVFIVSLWRTTEGYRGHYKKITVDANGNQISVVYDSNKPIGNTTTNWPFVISSISVPNQDYIIGGTVSDNTVTNTPNAGGFIEGRFIMQVLNPNCFTPPNNACSLQAQWTVKKDPGLRHPNEPDFNIPTNVILTKE